MLLLFACLETDAALPTMGLVGLQKPTISSPVAPLVVTGFFALAVVSCYIDIVHITVQALLLSYAADRELNDQTGMYVMTDRLKRILTDEKSNPPFRNVGKRLDADSVPKPREHEGLRGKVFLSQSAQTSGKDTGLCLEQHDTAKILV